MRDKEIVEMKLSRRETQILQVINKGWFSGWQLQEELWKKGFKKEEVRNFAEKVNRDDIKNYPSTLIKEYVDGKAVYYEDVGDCLPGASY